MIQRFFHFFQICFFYTVRPFIGNLPNRWVWFLARTVGDVLFHIKKGRCHRAELEVRLLTASADKVDDSIVRNGFRLFVYNNFLTYCYHRMTPTSISDWIDISDPFPIHQALARGHGAIVILMHFGANQMAMPALGHRGFTINQIGSRPEDWHRLTGVTPNYFESKLAALRFKSEIYLPANFIYIDKSMLPVMKHLKRNEIVMMAADGRAGLKFFEVPVMNRIMSISQGPFRLAAATHSALIPAFSVFDPDTCRYRLEIEPEIIPKSGPSDDRHLQNLADEFADRVSSRLSQHPDHYCILMSEARLRSVHDAVPLFKDYPAASLSGGGLRNE